MVNSVKDVFNPWIHFKNCPQITSNQNQIYSTRYKWYKAIVHEKTHMI